VRDLSDTANEEGQKSVINIYCDESCHLEHDGHPVMCLGAVWTPSEEAGRLGRELKGLKESFKCRGELKWEKVSRSREEFFVKVVDWFFGDPSLHFRALVVANKPALNHAAFNKGSHNDFYYKMYFSLLNKILSPDKSHSVYIDFKDTQSQLTVRTLGDVLCRDKFDFTSEMIRRIEHVRSHQVELVQLTDFLLGAVSYENRNLFQNPAKAAVVKRISEYHRQSLKRSTALREEKFNVFIFQPRLQEDVH
jgi:hypothetical protein